MSIGRTGQRWAAIVIGLVVVVFGIACFNYTKPGTLEHHQAWAGEHGRLAPGDGILWAGAAAAVLGAFALGFGVARLRSSGA